MPRPGKKLKITIPETDAPHGAFEGSPDRCHAKAGGTPIKGEEDRKTEAVEISQPASSRLPTYFVKCISPGFVPVSFRDSSFPLDFGPMLDWMRAFRKGTPLGSKPDNVVNHNSLQVMQAERFVFCSRRDFALVEDMINEELRFSVGPRLDFA